MTAYYNEIDQSTAAWLRELIKRNLIAPGDVDERSIADVSADDVRGYVQAHFFAGIGVWSYALRQAGWPDDRPVWTGSCPCQPFSAAGKGEGYADERHLWPHWNRLISECSPATVFGEQVDAAIRTGWLDDVCLSLESLGYAVGAVSFPACSVGAPHIRQRLYFVAESEGGRKGAAQLSGRRNGSISDGKLGDTEINGSRPQHRQSGEDARRQEQIGRSSVPFVMGDTIEQGPQGRERPGNMELHGGTRPDGSTATAGVPDIMGQPTSERLQDGNRPRVRAEGQRNAEFECAEQPSATNGFWRNAEWIACRDGKSRPVEPGVAPLVAGASARVVRLRGYGNSINAVQAQAFVEAYVSATT